jgi:hypothetical protein
VALVVFLRGINVGGHRRFRPAVLARRLAHLDAVNIGAAGTFLVRREISRAGLRREIARRLPFEAEIMICSGREIIQLLSRDFFAGHRSRQDVIRFVSILRGRPRRSPRLPVLLPARGPWLVRVLARQGRFVVGMHRRRMAAIGALGQLDAVFGVTATTRSWTTMVAISRKLREGRR